ncbi:hypothetical protein PAECIP111802_04938 [Paenibacillus allorhizosphaerae]|uniref:Uncharacterized protein n=1 Tax=Paenibacillus allorhizosphaerae TaxID=2849866 RepID=A0ABN7TQG1_9BACL|nr:hypothetical protein PAECIP111802_04938 [Paenibacillus allorhizosphaerae]
MPLSLVRTRIYRLLSIYRSLLSCFLIGAIIKTSGCIGNPVMAILEVFYDSAITKENENSNSENKRQQQ